MSEPKSAHGLRWIAAGAFVVGGIAMITSGEPNTLQAAVFGGGCALLALAALVLDSAVN